MNNIVPLCSLQTLKGWITMKFRKCLLSLLEPSDLGSTERGPKCVLHWNPTDATSAKTYQPRKRPA
jgi:hypothetical protein